MATRANIILRYGASEVYLYRHWDGYPSETGADILKKATEAGSLNGLLEALLSERDGGDRVYELTSGMHGDIEWGYAVEVARDGSLRFGVREFPIGAGPDRVNGALIPAIYDAASFAEVVNAAIREYNRRARTMGFKLRDYVAVNGGAS
jgi:hypothetical protein